MHEITSQPTTGATIKQFPQADPLRTIERAMQQLVDSGRARFATLILTDDNGHMTEIELAAPQQ